MRDNFPSLHVLGNRQFGGADQFYVRLVRALSEIGETVTAVNRMTSPVAEALAESGIEQIHFPFLNKWDLWSVREIRRLVARRDPCIVQTYMGRATRLTRLPGKTGAVHIARLGGYYKIDGYYRHAHAWIGNTRGVCDYLVRSGLPAERVFQIGNFVPDPIPAGVEDLASLRQTWNIPQNAWVVFTLGRLIDIKGFDDLLRALAAMPAEIGGRPVVLLIAGDGPLAADLKALSDSLGLRERVRWLGWQSRPDTFYCLADVFVCPSRHETLGNVILEAWNYGLPVIATKTPGALELVEDERTGFLCPCEDSTALAGRLQTLLTAREQGRIELGALGQAHLRKHFSRSAIVEAYLELYRSLMTSGGF